MPQYSLPYRQLPGTRTDLTPESVLEQEIQTGRQQIQQQFTLAWDEIGRSARFIGQRKALSMRQQLHAKAKQEMLQFGQQAQQQLAQLRNVDRLAEQGAITNPEEIKARLTLDPAVVKGMYPTPEKEPSIPEQFGKLDVYSHRISQELEHFQIVGAKRSSKFLARLKGISPLATAISALRGPPKGRKGELQIYDPTIPKKDPEPDEDIMGIWRKAEPGEIGIYQAWLQEERDVAARKRELLGQPDITRRKAGIAKSGFDAGVTESMPKPAIKRRQQPKVIRQRNRRTGEERVSYDGGKTWQTSG